MATTTLDVKVDETIRWQQPPFYEFAQGVQPQSVLRAAITAAYRRPEEECVPSLINQARLEQPGRVAELAHRLVDALRKKGRGGGIDALIQEFSLSSQEGVALMCLAEALLRIPDKATRDALIRDKISHGDWRAHMNGIASLFVHAATWGLVLTGKLVAVNSERSLSRALTRLIAKGGEPLIRQGINMAMRMMGEQFVAGQTIGAAIANGRKQEAKGFRYSYDMLGEAATTAEDATRYYSAYEQAVHAIGKASGGKGIYDGPGISIKLSALHPRYSRSQRERVMAELLPRVVALCTLARKYDIGVNIDAEEADRLELSLDVLEALCLDPAFGGWNGIGFVVQAYQKRAPFVIDYIIDLAQRSRRRVMVRLVKGAYWDTEIKRAQVDGLEGYPVYTRKAYTDLSYLACARKLLAAPQAVFPQFATHNAHTVAAVYYMAGQNYYPGQYEFQCLHGMGEGLYEEITGPSASGKLNRPCRIYAPVGTHDTLLAYLVRRLLENGANTSFVNQISDESIPVEALVADPAEVAARVRPIGVPHEKIPLPRDLYKKSESRINSAGLDLTNEHRLSSLSAALLNGVSREWIAGPVIGGDKPVWDGKRALLVRNPANHQDVVGHVVEANAAEMAEAIDAAVNAAPIWQSTPVEARASVLMTAAGMMEDEMQGLLGLLVREAGKSLPNAIAEVREAVDFLRYYAGQIRATFDNDTHRPLGPVLCISPWNFPLAIFTGQVVAALAAGNVVLAKPAEQTPLIAAQAIDILRRAGVPKGALQLLPGRGETVGAALVARPEIRGVVFTGSTSVAKQISRQLAERLDDHGRPIPLIAETGGQNAMIVDSSALSEQVVMDVLASAFDSAGQRCSALRLLCVQEDSAELLIRMLRGALQELKVGNPDVLSVDVGPVIDAEALQAIASHIEAMRDADFKISQAPAPAVEQEGFFVRPTMIEIDKVDVLKSEVFGPVLHVLRYKRQDLDRVIDAINSTGYGLTFGVHTRLDETMAHVTEKVRAGNIYVNRNIVGAVVGVQPFGGEGLSGTGPKAGGPLYLRRLLACSPTGLPDWCRVGEAPISLQGPTGEENLYELRPRGAVLCVSATAEGAALQLEACRQTGNKPVFLDSEASRTFIDAARVEAPRDASAAPRLVPAEYVQEGDYDAVLFEGDSDALKDMSRLIAARPGPIISVEGLSSDEIAQGHGYRLERLMREVSCSINTAAAGGNASLMMVG